MGIFRVRIKVVRAFCVKSKFYNSDKQDRELIDMKHLNYTKRKVIAMSMEIHNTYSSYLTSCASTVPEENESTKYSNVQEYRNYLSEKFECMNNTDYSVEINSSLLSKAANDEKTARWLEYNLSLIPKGYNSLKSMAAARGAKVVSYSVKIEGYDSMSSQACTVCEADLGTEKKASKRAERKAEEEKAAARRAERQAAKKETVERIAESKKTERYNLTITGANMECITRSIIDRVSGMFTSSTSGFDVKV